tara:strand:+ start:14 stop:859 length:846 start_codon:yes stop_codon:yes gene_type:complete
MSADFGAASLDITREKFKQNFIHCGISEQAMFDIATGLALENKKVLTYAMGPFISLRAIEQIKCGPGMMDLPMTILSVGIGLGYADAGPTHYATEDYACLRAIGGTKIFTASDNHIAENIAKKVMNNNSLNYVRLDRHPTENINFKNINYDFEDGFRIFGDYSENKFAIVSHGRILRNCLKTIDVLGDNYFLIDLFRSKPISKKFSEIMSKIKKIIVVDEQTQYGNLTSAVQSELANNDLFPIIKNVSLPDEYVFQNGGRDYLLKKYNLDEISILNFCKNI